MPRGRVPVENGFVTIRNVSLSVEQVRAAMLEYGGTFVANEELSLRLDRSMLEHREKTNEWPEMMGDLSEPAITFIPIKVNVEQRSPSGLKLRDAPSAFVYMAVKKLFHA